VRHVENDAIQSVEQGVETISQKKQSLGMDLCVRRDRTLYV